MKKTILLVLISLFSTLTFANEIHSNVQIKEVVQVNDSAFVNIDEGLTICNFAGIKGCSPVLVGYILSNTLLSTDAINQLIDAKDNQKSVNLTTDGVDQGYSKIISVELATK